MTDVKNLTVNKVVKGNIWQFSKVTDFFFKLTVDRSVKMWQMTILIEIKEKLNIKTFEQNFTLIRTLAKNNWQITQKIARIGKTKVLILLKLAIFKK